MPPGPGLDPPLAYSITTLQTVYRGSRRGAYWFVGFLTAMRQEVTRAHKGWSLDSVMLHNDVTKWAREDITNPPSVSIHLLPAFKPSA